MKAVAIISLLALTPLGWLSALADQRPAPSPLPAPVSRTEAQNLFFFHDARPIFIRLHIRIDRQPFRTSWNSYLDKLFDFLDANGDGVLSKNELAHAPSPQQLLQQMQGIVAVEPDPAPPFREVDTTPTDGRVTRRELKNYYHRAGVGALQLQIGQRQPGEDVLSDVLFRLLDRDHDGKLSQQELVAAASTLRPLDVDDDEMITVTELLDQRPTSGFIFRTPLFSDKESSPAVLLEPGDSPDPLVHQLLRHYDKNHDNKLSRMEIGLDRETFDRLDRDRDGALDATELAEWPSGEPDLELIVDCGTNLAEPAITVVPRRDGTMRPLASALQRTRYGTLLLPLAETQVEFQINGDRGLSTRRRTSREEMLEKFKGADLNRNGYLEDKEVYQEPFELVGLLRLADRDGDGRVSGKEFREYLDLQATEWRHGMVLTVADRGRTFFDFLDADHDGRLGLRELHSAWQRVSRWERNGAGHITRADIPRQFLLTFSRGRAGGSPRMDGAPGYGPAARSVDRSRGPLWFRNMDRNRDGDLSRREFLGTDEQFRQLDTDGDGFISVEEAEAADRHWRSNRVGQSR
jgi:Ca2+-binding EF-hand superfamily protein